MVLRRILIFSLFIQLHFFAHSSNNDSLLNPLFLTIYNQQFDQAESLLSKQKVQLGAFYFDVLNIDLHWWKYSTSRSKKDAEKLNFVLKEYVDSGIKNKNQVIQLIGKSYQLRYARKKYNIYSVSTLSSEIKQLLLEVHRNELQISGSELKLFDLYMSMFHYFDHINLFSIWKKTSEQKLWLLEMENFSQEENLIVNTMAHYFLGRIYQKIEKEPQKGKDHFEILTGRFPGNRLFKEYFEDCKQKI